MTTASEQQSGGKPDEASDEPSDSMMRIFRDSFNLLGIIGGLITVGGAIFAWTILGTSALLKTLVTVIVFAIAITFVCVGRLKKTKQLSRIIITTAVSVGVTCICATLIIAHFYENRPPSPTQVISPESAVKRDTTIRFDQRGTVASPITVTCQYTIPVSGHLPEGYDFAIGNLVIGGAPGDTAPVFVPETAPIVVYQDGTWQVPVTFGDSSDTGHKFNVYLIVLPAQELSYLVTEGQQMRSIEAKRLLTGNAQKNAEQQAINQSWWVAPASPPPPAFTVDRQVYQRSSTSSGC